MIKCFERSTVERIEETSNAEYGHGKMKNKKLTNRGKKRHYTRMPVLLSLISPWKRKEEKRKKKLLQHGVFVLGHPSKYCLNRTGLNFVEQTKHVAVLVVYSLHSERIFFKISKMRKSI